MKLEDVLYKTPEITEEKLLNLIDKKKYVLYKEWAKKKNYSSQEILDEWDLIQAKKSKLSKDQRDQICFLVSMCLIEMTKDGGRDTQSTD